MVLVRLQPGVLYTFESIDEGNSISNLFAMRTQNTEKEVDYENE